MICRVETGRKTMNKSMDENVLELTIGAILFLLTKKTDSVWPAAFLHAVNNAVPNGSILMLMYSDKNLTGVFRKVPAGSQTAAPARHGHYPVR